MFSRNRRVAILAFLIAAFLMLGHANGFSELPALTLAPLRGQEATTTTTITTPTTIISNAARQLNLKSETTSATSATSTASPPHDEIRLAMVGVATSESFGNSDVPKQSVATKSFSGHATQTESVENENEGSGNAVKIAQIKYAKEQVETEKATRATATTATTRATTPTSPTTPGTTNTESAPTGAALRPIQQSPFSLESLQPGVHGRTNEANPSQKTTMTTNGTVGPEEESAAEATDGSASATVQPLQPGVRVERQLENGLVRIKLAEIVTDGFNVAAATATPTAHATIRENGQMSTPSTAVHMPKTAFSGSKVNIADLYPLKIEDFNPIIRDSNAKLLKERTIFSQEDVEAHRQNLLPNEVEVDRDAAVDASANRAAVILNANNEPLALRPTVNHHPTATAAGNTAPHRAAADSISDFTGKLLAEQDGVITEIEQKFRLNEFVATESSPGSSRHSEASKTNVKIATNAPAGKSLGWHSVNHKTLMGHDFIDRRVKKSFDFPMHRLASDALVVPHVDFANTKFNTDTNVLSAARSDGQSVVVNGDKVVPVASHPEFSTTKFYNSKELYNQLLQHQRENLLRSQQQEQQQQQLGTTTIRPNQVTSYDSSPLLKTTTTTTGSPIALTSPAASIKTTTATTTTTPIDPLTSTPSHGPVVASSSSPSVTSAKPLKKYEKELKRAKLLLKGILSSSKVPLRATTTTPLTAPEEAVTLTTAGWPSASPTVTATTAKTVVTSSAAVTDNTLSVAAVAQHTTAPSIGGTTNAPSSSNSNNTSSTSVSRTTDSRRTTNPTKSSSKPIARPRVLSRLQEKINSLECEIQNIPQDSHLWRGNETHELMLPIVEPKNCKSQDDCTSVVTSWEGEAEIQSGDILIVEINDALLNENERPKINSGSHSPQVYQVTRSGHEHCDVTEGILLDITPLVVDGRKLVTLYDKDLTEGVNLLIVVSELWGTQCVRLKVTTKTDNCGENADCSGKGVCFSNPSMEEYECQCCSGFAGPHCEEIDACTPSPCTNNGICVDLSQGHEGNSYQCLCPYGYTGKNCQYEADPCNPVECLNGGSCVGNSTHFRCDCSPGYTGPLCQHSLNECESSPCVHGICVDQEDGFRCFCQPGFAGELCNFEYNECESNPCQNAGECIDHIGSYECRCSKGYTGSRCQKKVDLCANKPCPAEHRCIDHGNDFGCECPGGQNGPDCNQLTRTQCNVNPCTHGGTCWSSGDSFYCACRPGYTGTMCEDEFVVETVISSSEFMVDDTSARNFNEKTFGSTVVLKSPIELHNAYFGAGVLAAAIFIVAIVVTICHCKVNQTYRKFSTRSSTFFPILGFGRRSKSQSKLNKHWLSGKGLGTGNPLRASSTRGGGGGGGGGSGSGHLPATNGNQYTTTGSTALQQQQQHQQPHQQQQQHLGLAGQLHERPFQRHLAMNLENDMYFTVDYSETSQHSPLIQ